MLPQEMYITYLHRRKLDLVELEKALAASNFDVFKRVGHQIKGNASSFGFDELVSLAEKMESVSQQDSVEIGQTILTELKAWIQRKEVEFAV